MDGVKRRWKLIVAGVAVVVLVAGGFTARRWWTQRPPSVSCSGEEVGTAMSMPRRECDVLADLFNANNRESVGRRFENWADESNPCRWVSLSCRNGHVDTIDLFGDGFSSAFVIPASIGDLTELTSLEVTSMGLEHVPSEIGELQNLKRLDLSGNRDLGELPPEIGRLGNLESLEVSSTGLTRLPTEVVQLQRLTALDVGSSRLQDFPVEVVELTELRTLRLGSNAFSLRDRPEALTRLVELEHLTSLSLWGTGLQQLPPEIGRLHDLAELELGDNELSGLPPEIAQLTQLGTLGLSGNGLSVLPDELGSLDQLHVLDVSGNDLNGGLSPTLGRLTGLNSLNLARNGLESLPPELATLTKLSDIDLSSNKLASVPSALLEINPIVLKLGENDLTEFGVPAGKLSNLAELDLSDNALADFPIDVTRLSRLTWLRLDGNKIRAVPTEVGELDNLKWLNLSFNELGGDQTDWLGPIVRNYEWQDEDPPEFDLSNNGCLSSTDPKVLDYLKGIYRVEICEGGS